MNLPELPANDRSRRTNLRSRRSDSDPAATALTWRARLGTILPGFIIGLLLMAPVVYYGAPLVLAHYRTATYKRQVPFKCDAYRRAVWYSLTNIDPKLDALCAAGN